MFRRLCETYQCLPTDLEKLTIDQLYILALDEKDLKLQGKHYTGTLDELIGMGLIPPPRDTTAERALAARRAKKDRRRAERRMRKEG